MGAPSSSLYLHHILPLSSLFPLLLLRLEMLAPRLWLVDVFEKKCALVKFRSREGKIKNQFYLNFKGTRIWENAFLPKFTCWTIEYFLLYIFVAFIVSWKYLRTRKWDETPRQFKDGKITPSLIKQILISIWKPFNNRIWKTY